ncbi:hypothetical protein AB0E59_38960 [Lentzea sp. NPDC034063]|uniref:hypothetical protein n=1 Tax=unclassified Lentzea TaxID=2643253 RepID=UPI0033CB6835
MTDADRSDAICQAYMLWQYENNSRQPNPGAFLKVDIEIPVGIVVTLTDLESCIEYLEAAGLITGHKVWGNPMPLRVKLTADGIRCAREFGGDVKAWNRRHLSHVDQSVHVHAQGDAQVIAHSQNVSQEKNARNSVQDGEEQPELHID